MKKLWLLLLFFVPLNAVAATCYNGCPAVPSDFPNICDLANWAVNRSSITPEEVKVNNTPEGAKLYIKISVSYLKPICASQGNVRPYDLDGVRLYVTAKPNGDSLGNYVVENKPEEHDLGLGTVLAGPVTMSPVEAESTDWEKQVFETPNQGILISSIQPVPENLKKFIDIVLYSTNGEFRPVGRKDFEPTYQENASFEITGGAYIMSVNGKGFGMPVRDTDSKKFVYDFKDVDLYVVDGTVVKGKPNEPPPGAQINPYDPPPTRGAFVPGDVIEFGLPFEGVGQDEYKEGTSPAPFGTGERWDRWDFLIGQQLVSNPATLGIPYVEPHILQNRRCLATDCGSYQWDPLNEYRAITHLTMPTVPVQVATKFVPKVIVKVADASLNEVTGPNVIERNQTPNLTWKPDLFELVTPGAWEMPTKELGVCSEGTPIPAPDSRSPMLCLRVHVGDFVGLKENLPASAGLLDHWEISNTAENKSFVTPSFPFTGGSRTLDSWTSVGSEASNAVMRMWFDLEDNGSFLYRSGYFGMRVPDHNVTVTAKAKKQRSLSLSNGAITGHNYETFYDMSGEQVLSRRDYWYPATRYDEKSSGNFYDGQRVAFHLNLPPELADLPGSSFIEVTDRVREAIPTIEGPADLTNFYKPELTLPKVVWFNMPARDLDLDAGYRTRRSLSEDENFRSQASFFNFSPWDYPQSDPWELSKTRDTTKPIGGVQIKVDLAPLTWNDDPPMPPIPQPRTLTVSGGESYIPAHWSWDNRRWVFNEVAFFNQWVLIGDWTYHPQSSSAVFYEGDSIKYYDPKQAPDHVDKLGFWIDGNACGTEGPDTMPDRDLNVVSVYIPQVFHDLPQPHGDVVECFVSPGLSDVCIWEDGYRSVGDEYWPPDYWGPGDRCGESNETPPIGPPPEEPPPVIPGKYSMTITGGSGSGQYEKGTQLTIDLDIPSDAVGAKVALWGGNQEHPGISNDLDSLLGAHFLYDSDGNFKNQLALTTTDSDTNICIGYRLQESLTWRELNNLTNSIPEAYAHTLPPSGEYAGLGEDERIRYLNIYAKKDDCPVWPDAPSPQTDPEVQLVSVNEGGFHVSTGGIGMDSGAAYRFMNRHWVYNIATSRWEMTGEWVLVPPELHYFNEHFYPNEVVNLVPRNTNACEEFKGWELSDGSDGRLTGNLFIVGNTYATLTAQFESHDSDWWWAHFDNPNDGMEDGINYCDYQGCNPINRHDLYLMCGEVPPEPPTEPPPTSGVPTYKFKVFGGVMDSFARGPDTFYDNAGLTEFDFRSGDQVWLQPTVEPPEGCYLLDGIFNPAGDYWFLNLPEPKIHMFEMPPYALTLTWAYSCYTGFSSMPVGKMSMLSHTITDEQLPETEFAITNGLAPVGKPFMLNGTGSDGSVKAAAAASCTQLTFVFDSERTKLVQVGDQYELHLPPQPGSASVHLYRYIPSKKSWVRLSDQTKMCLSEPGVYQAFAHTSALGAIGAIEEFGEVYVFPNPTKSGSDGTLHMEMTQVDRLSVRIYDLSGDLVYSANDFDRPSVINGKSAYERKLDGNLFKAGVYLGTVTASKAGQEDVRKKFKFTVEK